MDVRWIDKFDDYRNGDLSEEQKTVLEEELAKNPEMNEAFLIFQQIEDNMRGLANQKTNEAELKETLQGLGSNYFIKENKNHPKLVPLYSRRSFRILSGIAATLLVFFVAYFLFFQSGPQLGQRAETFYATNYSELGLTMGEKDLMQTGIAAYNEGDFETAKRSFNQVLEADPNNSEATKNLGLTHLAIAEYDAAIGQFEILSERVDLYSNPGLFLKAITLLLREQEGDEAEARSLLERVRDENLEGAQQASNWLKGEK